MGWFSGKDKEEDAGSASAPAQAGAQPPPDPRRSLAGVSADAPAGPLPGPTDAPPSEFGPSVEIEGSVEGHGDVVLQGCVRGSISVTGMLTIEESGRVQADCLAREVDAAGTVEGNIKAAEKVLVRASATVQGDIDAPCIVIEDGGGVEGYVQMQPPAGEDDDFDEVSQPPQGESVSATESSWPRAGRLRGRNGRPAELAPPATSPHLTGTPPTDAEADNSPSHPHPPAEPAQPDASPGEPAGPFPGRSVSDGAADHRGPFPGEQGPPPA